MLVVSFFVISTTPLNQNLKAHLKSNISLGLLLISKHISSKYICGLNFIDSPLGMNLLTNALNSNPLSTVIDFTFISFFIIYS